MHCTWMLWTNMNKADEWVKLYHTISLTISASHLSPGSTSIAQQAAAHNHYPALRDCHIHGSHIQDGQVWSVQWVVLEHSHQIYPQATVQSCLHQLIMSSLSISVSSRKSATCCERASICLSDTSEQTLKCFRYWYGLICLQHITVFYTPVSCSINDNIVWCCIIDI